MSLRLLIFVACLCVVRASVIHGSSADELKESPRSCNYRECEQWCKRLGFPGGACVSDRCKCDNFRNDNNVVSEESEPAFEAVKDKNDVEELTSSRSCYYRECEQRCKRLGFSGGACVNDRCKCDNIRKTYNNEPNMESKAAVDAMVDPSEDNELISSRICLYKECENRCRRHGFPGGTCVNSQCKCNSNRNNLSNEPNKESNVEVVAIKDQSEDNELATSRICHYKECEQRCQRLGFSGGACVNNRCKCDNLRNNINEEPNMESGAAVDAMIDPSEDNNELPSARICFYNECEQRCRRHGFEGGACVDNRCKCNNNRNILSNKPNMQSVAAVDIMEDQSELNELASSRLTCYFKICERRCRRLGFSGGICANSQCKCDNLRSNLNDEPNMESKVEVDAMEDPSEDNESSLARICYYRECEHRCRGLGYSGGACVNGKCKCDNNRKSDLVPEPELVAVVGLPDTSDVLTSPRSCHYRECEQRCQRLGYSGGACVNGNCKCDSFRSASDDIHIGATLETVIDQSHTDESKSSNSCYYKRCEKRCQKLGFTGGACVDDRCRCDTLKL